MMTTVREIIDALSDYDDDAPVLIAHQPSWPLAEVVGNITTADPDLDPEDEDDTAEDNTVWLVAGGHPHDRSPYAPSDVFTSW